MKTPSEAVTAVQTRVKSSWAAEAAAVVGAATVEPGERRWPYGVPLGEPSQAELTRNFPAYVTQVATWRRWAGEHDVELRHRARRVNNTPQQLPTHLEVPDVDTAARLVGGTWPRRLRQGRVRGAELATRYPHLADDLARVISQVDPLSDLDFNLLCRAADWFAVNDATGLTPRQVPIEGLHAKWLNHRATLVCRLAGIESMGTLPRHPARLHLTYLDPAHRAAGGRRHDVANVGDVDALAYQPQVVIISENKDTAVGFPEVPGGIAIEGVGRGGGTAAKFGWLTGAPCVLYWGDMDPDGLEILSEFRAVGVPARSILMSTHHYDRWERYGTNTTVNGKELGSRSPGKIEHLDADEALLYNRLIDPSWTRHRRIEQERIPLDVALSEVLDARGD